MKAQDRYLQFVRWEEADGLYVGYCPDLFPWGGACHGATEEGCDGGLKWSLEEAVGSSTDFTDSTDGRGWNGGFPRGRGLTSEVYGGPKRGAC